MVIDLLYDADGKFVEKDGDFDFKDASSALMEDILLSAQGHYKEFPSIGINMYQYLNARANIQVIVRDISVGLQADVFKKPVFNMKDFPSSITIDNLLFEIAPKEEENVV